MINVINSIIILMLLIAVSIVVLVVGLPVLLKDGLEAWSEFIEKVKEYKNGRHN